MFEFPKKLKTLSIILIVIGVISIGASFFTSGGEHHDEGGHGEHTEKAEHQHGDKDHETDKGHGDDDASSHESGGVHEDHDDDGNHLSERGEDLEGDRSYHKTAARANVDNSDNYYYLEGHHDEEHIHHQKENKPWANLMASNFFFLAISLGALFFLAVQYAAQVGWSAVLLRVMEAMSQFLWIPMLIMLVLIITGWMHIGGNHIWHWMAEGIMDPNSDNYDEIIAGKEAYLNGPFFLARTIVYFIGWVGAAWMLRKMSMKMDSGAVDPNVQWVKMRNFSAGFLVFFAITSSTSAWDWIMSIDTHWFSTLFGWYTFAGMFVSALTVMTLIVIYLKNKGYLEEVNHSHIHDLGKFMFAFSVFWTYLWFSQFMLIWYGNIPEEVTYYMARFGEYQFIFWLMVIINFVFPLLILMGRTAKRNFGVLVFAGIGMIIGHWMDVFIMVTPGTVGGQWSIGLTTIGTFLGFAGLFIYVVFTALSKAPLMIKNHPMLTESKYHHI